MCVLFAQVLSKLKLGYGCRPLGCTRVLSKEWPSALVQVVYKVPGKINFLPIFSCHENQEGHKWENIDFSFLSDMRHLHFSFSLSIDDVFCVQGTFSLIHAPSRLLRDSIWVCGCVCIRIGESVPLLCVCVWSECISPSFSVIVSPSVFGRPMEAIDTLLCVLPLRSLRSQSLSFTRSRSFFPFPQWKRKEEEHLLHAHTHTRTAAIGFVALYQTSFHASKFNVFYSCVLGGIKRRWGKKGAASSYWGSRRNPSWTTIDERVEGKTSSQACNICTREQSSLIYYFFLHTFWRENNLCSHRLVFF